MRAGLAIAGTIGASSANRCRPLLPARVHHSDLLIVDGDAEIGVAGLKLGDLAPER